MITDRQLIELKVAAEKAQVAFNSFICSETDYDIIIFHRLANPATILSLIEEIELLDGLHSVVRNRVLEEAAKIAEQHTPECGDSGRCIATAVRAMKSTTVR